MSKFSNLLRLITLLKSNKRIKRKEIADALGVSERMVRKYISDLQEANITIESIPGPNGGYELKGHNYLLNLNTDNEEVKSLEKALEQLKQQEFEYIDDLESLTKKVKSNNELTNDITYGIISESEETYLDKEEDYELEIQSACLMRHKLKMSYHSISSGDSIRVIRPYAVITKNDMKYVIAYCENRKTIRTFKLIRINWIEVLSDKFDINSSFDIKEYMKNTIGIFNNDEIKLKLLLKKPFSYSVSERKYVENQHITWNDDETIIFEATMNGKEDIIRWILSMGECVTILEPLYLKEELKNILKNMINTI
ncbi:helix-turn-helix transcriptional regulator [Romboutsia timonensis]|uniref:helix-turn-helix transcriptional regulator n=1 Tax=Romboutsia timonensis TaxID=1776391 RepID=UPI0008DAEA19|nr:WYL domain-containing protein [Romboutsia timonensis]